jgi:hypothetical protein
MLELWVLDAVSECYVIMTFKGFAVSCKYLLWMNLDVKVTSLLQIFENLNAEQF